MSGAGAPPQRREPGPVPLPDVSVDDVDPAVRRELRSLGRDREERVTLHLASAMSAIVLDDTDTAVAQVDEAVALAPRLGVVRETAGVVHYRAGDFTQALRELRTARRMGSGPELLPVMVDCERALGRLTRALGLAEEARVEDLDRPTQIELAVVVAGTRRDLGDIPAGLRALEVPELRSSAPASIRLRYAYADLLEAADRPEEALTWFTRVAQVDGSGETDAAERVLSLQGLSIDSDDEDEDDDDGDPDGDPGHDADGDAVDAHGPGVPEPRVTDGGTGPGAQAARDDSPGHD